MNTRDIQKAEKAKLAEREGEKADSLGLPGFWLQ